MYYYPTLTPEQQNEIVEYRRQQRRPWHSPPHCNFEGERQFFISCACFEHAHIIGAGHERMTECENDLLEVCGNYVSVIVRVGRETAETIWREYPILDYGKKWDADLQNEPEESASEGRHSARICF